MILSNHPTGNENVRQAALALAETGQLFEFWTCVGSELSMDKHGGLVGMLKRAFMRRALPREVSSRTRYVPVSEVLRLAGARTIGNILRNRPSIDSVYRGLDRVASRRIRIARGLSSVFGYEDGSLSMFRAAREGGLKKIYELPMGYWRAWREMLNDERAISPEWASTLQGTEDSEDKLLRKECELDLADVVLVASDFARRTLEVHGRCRAPIHVLPYGVSVTLAEPVLNRKGDPLKVVYVGALTQRKGVSYLFEAVRQIRKHVEVLIIGAAPSSPCKPLSNALKGVRWIPTASHSVVLQEVRRCDVLVLPSLFEGFGLVILEALSQGVTVVTTENTGGADVLTDGRDGFIVPIRSVDGIRERLAMLIESPALLENMRREALATARRSSWTEYRKRFVNCCRTMDNEICLMGR